MFQFIYDIIMGIFSSKPIDDNILTSKHNHVAIDEEWIIILSEYEEKIDEKRRTEVNIDIQSLKDRSTKLAYKDLIVDIRTIMSNHEYGDTLISVDLKLSIFKNVFNDLSPIWLGMLNKFVPEISTYWYPTDYERNILGELIAIATQFCPNKLCPRGLSQSIMAIHLSLTNSIHCLQNQIHFGTNKTVTLTHEESNTILKMLMSTSVDRIVKLWIETSKNANRTVNKLGKLPTRWKIEENERQAKYKYLKVTNSIDAKYITIEIDPIRRKYLLDRFGIGGFTIGNKPIDFQYNSSHQNEKNTHPKEEFLEVRKSLANILQFKVMSCSQ